MATAQPCVGGHGESARQRQGDMGVMPVNSGWPSPSSIRAYLYTKSIQLHHVILDRINEPREEGNTSRSHRPRT